MRMKMSKTETYEIKRGTPCVKDFGNGWELGELFRDGSYDITNLKLSTYNENEYAQGMFYSFELWDEKGLIGNYKVRKLDWEENSKEVI